MPWLLVIGLGILTVLLRLNFVRVVGVPWPLIMIAAPALASILILMRLLVGPADGIEEAGISRGLGLWLSALSALVALAGTLMAYVESGGRLSDLRDPEKLRAAFRRDLSGSH